jgi:hypothetical protein
MCNTEQEVISITNLGAKAFYMNHNVFVDYKIFDILPGTKKKYSAIYNAQIASFKRHYLCSKLTDVALLYHSGGPNLNQATKELFEKIQSEMPAAIFLNGLKNPLSHPGLSKKEVCTVTNQAHVGLCLSAVEGAMHASVEYLLCGLPVVSTVNKGGRDIFSNNEFWRTVEPTQEDVALGVGTIMQENINSKKIRQITIQKIDEHRQRFIEFISKLLAEAGIFVDYHRIWPEIYFDKLLAHESKESFRKRLS